MSIGLPTMSISNVGFYEASLGRAYSEAAFYVGGTEV